MWPLRANPGFRPLGRFAPFAVNSGLRPETHYKNAMAVKRGPTSNGADKYSPT